MKRENRRVGRTEFQRAFQLGAVASNRFLALYIGNHSGSEAKVAVAAGKRLGTSVVRNRVRRRVREIIRRRFLHLLPPGKSVILIARQAAVSAGFSELQRSVEDVLLRGSLLGGDGG